MTAPDAPFDPGNRLVVALDVPTRRDALDLVQRIGGAASWVKVGLELFSAVGPDAVGSLLDLGYEVFLDLTDDEAFTSLTTIRFESRESGATTFLELADAEDVRIWRDGEES